MGTFLHPPLESQGKGFESSPYTKALQWFSSDISGWNFIDLKHKRAVLNLQLMKPPQKKSASHPNEASRRPLAATSEGYRVVPARLPWQTNSPCSELGREVMSVFTVLRPQPKQLCHNSGQHLLVFIVKQTYGQQKQLHMEIISFYWL